MSADARVLLDAVLRASTLLAELEDVPSSVGRVIESLLAVIPIEVATVCEHRAGAWTVDIWRGPSAPPLRRAKTEQAALASLDYFLAAGRPAQAQVEVRHHMLAGFEAKRLPRSTVRVVTLPLASAGEPAFGVLRVEAATLDERQLTMLSLIANHMAVAMDRRFRVAAEREAFYREQRADARAKELERFHRLAEAMPQMVWTCDNDGKLVHVNRRWEEYFGDARDWASCLHPADLEASQKAWERARLRRETFSVERRLRAQDGSYHWHLCRAVPDRDGWIGTSTDVEELMVAKARAEAANLAKSAFLANVSHEIRTPLTAIAGFADLVRDEANPCERQRHLEVISRNARELAKLINDILDLSKVEAERLDVERIAFSLPDLLADVTTSLQPLAREKGLALVVESVGRVPDRIVSDPTRLRQILLNIIGNALKFTAEGRVGVAVRVVANAPPLLEIRVSDTGQGIDPEAQARVFEPFTQADSSTTRRFGGTGLGLAISLRLAEALGGTIRLESSVPGEGSTFVIVIALEADAAAAAFVLPASLPRAEKTPEQGTSAAKGPAEKTPAEKSLAGLRILVADDAIDNRMLLNYLLTSRGARVELAEDGAKAISLAATRPYDVVLMDLQMPRVDGYHAAAELRRRGCQTAIIAVTAHALPEERERSRLSGCDDLLEKPINFAVLLDKIRSCTSTLPH